MFPLTSAKFVGLDGSGNPLALGRVYTYAAGTTTPQATYTTQALSTQNANPVVLDSAGRASIWLDPDLTYRIVLKDSNDSTVYDVDNVSSGAAGTLPAEDITFSPAGSAEVPSVQDKLRERISVKDFGAVGDGVTDDTSAIQAAIDYAATLTGTGDYTDTGVGIFFPPGDYLISSSLTITSGGIGLYGAPGRGPRIITNQSSIDMVVVGDSGDSSNTWEVHFENLLFYATVSENTGVVGIRVYRTFMGSVRWCAFENCYDAFVGHRANRWMFHGVRTWQNRTTTAARSSFRFLGLASGSGGGFHMSNCELAGGGSLAPSVDAHILIESCDGLYASGVHTRDCNHGVKVNPDGTATKNVIDSLFFSNCYWDENYLYNVWLTGSVASGGRYQFIRFANCYARGMGGSSTNCVRVGVSNAGGFTGKVQGISFIGGEMRQANSTAALIQGSTNSFLECYGVTFNGVTFEDNNQGGAAATSDIQCEAETLTVTGCVFAEADNAPTRCVQANLSGPDSNEPSATITGNDLSKANCTGEPITYTQSASGTIVQIADNAFPGLGRGVDQVYKLRTTDATTTSVWEFVVPQGSAGHVRASLGGVSSDGGIAAAYTWETGFRRNASATTLSTGTSSWTAGVAWNPDSLGTVPTADLSTNTLRVRVTGPAAETAGAFVVGRTYRIVTAGTTNFTLIGAANSNVGTEFTATGVGTGTGTARAVMEWSCQIKLTAAR